MWDRDWLLTTEAWLCDSVGCGFGVMLALRFMASVVSDVPIGAAASEGKGFVVEAVGWLAGWSRGGAAAWLAAVLLLRRFDVPDSLLEAGIGFAFVLDLPRLASLGLVVGSIVASCRVAGAIMVPMVSGSGSSRRLMGST